LRRETVDETGHSRDGTPKMEKLRAPVVADRAFRDLRVGFLRG
jgi:hypothetical protein